MAALGVITLSVVLGVGNFEAEIGEIEVPLNAKTKSPTRLPDGFLGLPVTVEIDGAAMRQRLAGLLRQAAATFEEVPVDADR